MSDNALPVSIGLAAGVSLIALFIVLSPQLPVRPTEPDINIDGTTWVARNTTQCADPWHKYYDDRTPVALKPNQTLVDYFFEENGIVILDREDLPNPDQSQVTCEACGCSSGLTLYLKVNTADVGKLNQYGFLVLSPNLPPSD